jgi:hypothetical protein
MGTFLMSFPGDIIKEFQQEQFSVLAALRWASPVPVDEQRSVSGGQWSVTGTLSQLRIL